MVNWHLNPAQKGHSAGRWLDSLLKSIFLEEADNKKNKRASYSVTSEAVEADQGKLSHKNGGVTDIESSSRSNLERNVLYCYQFLRAIISK